jgi:hypothetical protein
VKFSPEALFHSPQSKSHRRNRANNEASLREALRSVHGPDHDLSQAGDAVVQPQQGQDEVEVLDEPRQRAVQPASASEREGGIRSGGRSGADVSASAAFDDYSLSNASYSFMPGPSAYTASGYGLATPALGPAHNRYAHIDGGLSASRSGGLFGAGTGADFSAISDGGYHEGYWRTKYMRPVSKQ